MANSTIAYFALAARETRDIADRCMQTFMESIGSSKDRLSAPREGHRPLADAGTSLPVRRRPLPTTTDRRPSLGVVPPLPPPSPLSTPPHLIDVGNPFNTLDGVSSSPEVSASPKHPERPRTDQTGPGNRSGLQRQERPPPAPERQPPPPPVEGKVFDGSTLTLPRQNDDMQRPSGENLGGQVRSEVPSTTEQLKAAFSPLEVYLKWSYASYESVNSAFSTARHPAAARTRSEGASAMKPFNDVSSQQSSENALTEAWYLSEVNGKTLLVGDVAENATLWTGAADDGKGARKTSSRKLSEKTLHRLVTHRSPCINWDNAREWYNSVLEVGQRWQQKNAINDIQLRHVQSYLQKLLYKASESLLRRPGRPMKEPEDIRFLMIMLANPLLYQPNTGDSGVDKPPAVSKRILGLLARSGKRALRYLDGWLVNLDNDFYQDMLGLCKRYMHYRLLRDVVPSQDKVDVWSPAGMVEQDIARKQTQRALANIDGDTEANLSYFDDWGLGTAGAFMFSLWNANLSRPARLRLPCNNWYNLFFDSMGEAAIKQDFVAWESRKPAFAFCYFPFLISMSAKITILTFDANRQQRDEARKAWQQQFNTAHVVSQNFHVHVRRECLAVDSLRSISEAAGSASHHKELKKGLRVHFEGEEGVDAGGLRKEFFLLLLRELLDPNHGLCFTRTNNASEQLLTISRLG